MESDTYPRVDECRWEHFNPRSPMESDNKDNAIRGSVENFNPRSPMESDRLQCRLEEYLLLISIHALLWRATRLSILTPMSCIFQSTLSYGERQMRKQYFDDERNNFNPRSPMESDSHYRRYENRSKYFNPRSPMESDGRLGLRKTKRFVDFNPRSPMESDAALSSKTSSSS